MGKKETTRNSYHYRINKVIDHIHDNLDRDMSLDELSEVACFAPYHFHRIYQSIIGETVKRSIRRFRLQRAAKDLVKTDKSLERIARKAGYENLDSFTRKFSEDFDITPNEYRKKGKLIFREITEPNMENKNMYEVEIKNIDKIIMASLDHKGDYTKISSKFEKMMAYMKHKGLLNEKTRCFGVYFDDPNSMPESELRSKACFTVGDDFVDEGEVKRFEVGPAKYGVIIYKGPYADISNAYMWLYQTWLVNSEYEIGDTPPLEEYLNDPREVPPSELLTAIYIPLK